ncbi:MAG: TolC family protein, partial [bacterium]
VEGRRSTMARLNAALDQPSETPIGEPRFPDRLLRAALPDSAGAVRFTSVALGARATGSLLPSLDSLQTLAVAHNAMLRAHEAEIRAQAARVELARRAHLPDFDFAIQYGQRPGRADMVTAMVSLPVPLQRARKQGAAAASAGAELASREAEHRAAINALRADVAQRVSEVDRARTQLALLTAAIVPQARATFASAASGYQVGRVSFASVIDAQATVFAIETAYHQSLTDFARAIAALEQMVGTEVIR